MPTGWPHVAAAVQFRLRALLAAIGRGLNASIRTRPILHTDAAGRESVANRLATLSAPRRTSKGSWLLWEGLSAPMLPIRCGSVPAI
ncbi:hypothetical protein [Lysobacter gummosus]|uniref:hypothetical protein n=1 Tax=Lysobacter gummosus TaxID=262324 RepID=UPI00362E26B8